MKKNTETARVITKGVFAVVMGLGFGALGSNLTPAYRGNAFSALVSTVSGAIAGVAAGIKTADYLFDEGHKLKDYIYSNNEEEA